MIIPIEMSSPHCNYLGRGCSGPPPALLPPLKMGERRRRSTAAPIPSKYRRIQALLAAAQSHLASQHCKKCLDPPTLTSLQRCEIPLGAQKWRLALWCSGGAPLVAAQSRFLEWLHWVRSGGTASGCAKLLQGTALLWVVVAAVGVLWGSPCWMAPRVFCPLDPLRYATAMHHRTSFVFYIPLQSLTSALSATDTLLSNSKAMVMFDKNIQHVLVCYFLSFLWKFMKAWARAFSCSDMLFGAHSIWAQY